MQLALCLCPLIVPKKTRTRLCLVMHHREQSKTTATGPLALAALENSELFVHGLRDRPLDLSHLKEEERRLLVLYPSDDARELSPELIGEDPRAITLVVPDGNWRQASRAARRIPGLAEAHKVTLPSGPPTDWGLRREPKAGGLATFEAIARSFGLIEGPELQQALEQLFSEMVRRQASQMPYLAIDRSDSSPQASHSPLEILFCDEQIAIINKPPGRLVHRGWGRDGLPLLQQLRDQLGCYLFPVHRLDRATSGVLLFAKTHRAAECLQSGLEAGRTKKRYLALCRGHDENLRRVDHPLEKEPGKGQRKPAITEFELLGKWGRYGLFEARPLTGRTHQIRRHLKHASHPIIGDVRYGKGVHNRFFREQYDFSRLALHCFELAFDHPDGQRLEVRAKLPDDYATLLRELEISIEHLEIDARRLPEPG